MNPVTRLVRWLLWSRTRAVAALAALAVLFIAGGMVASYARAYVQYQRDLAAWEADGSTPSETGWTLPSVIDPAPITTLTPTTSSTSTVPSVVGEPPAADPLPVSPAETPEAAARAFIAAWLDGRTATDRDAWLEDVSALTDPGMHPFLAATAPDAIPASTVAAVIPAPGSNSARAQVVANLVDGTSVLVTLVPVGGGWLVAEYGPNA